MTRKIQGAGGIWASPSDTHTITTHTQLQHTHNYNTHTITTHTQLHHTHNYNTHTITTHTQLQHTHNYNTHTITTHTHNYNTHTITTHTHNYNTHTITTHTQSPDLQPLSIPPSYARSKHFSRVHIRVHFARCKCIGANVCVARALRHSKASLCANLRTTSPV